MKLKSLSLENFMPFKGKQQIEFPQDGHRNVLLIFGENMRGKTSLLNSIRWVLYGRALGRHSREIPLHQIMNIEAVAEGDRIIEVSLAFEHDGSDYSIKRRAEKNGLVPVPKRPEDFAVSVLLERDGIPVVSDLFEQAIAEIVPEQISRFFLFDGELLQEYEALLMETSKQGLEIKESIEQVLGVPSLTHARDDLQALLRTARRTQQRDLAQIQGMATDAERQQQLSDKEETLNSDLRKLREQLANIRSRSNDLQADIDEHEASYAQSNKLNQYKLEKQHVQQGLDRLNETRLELMSSAWMDLLATKAEVARIALEEEQDSLTSRAIELTKLQTEIDNINTLLNGHVCPVCTQEISDASRNEYLGRIQKLQMNQTSSIELQERRDAIRTRISQIHSVRTQSIRKHLLDLRNQEDESNVQLISLDNRIHELNETLRGFDSESIERKRIEQHQLIREDTRLVDDIARTDQELEKTRTDLKMLQLKTSLHTQGREKLSTRKVQVIQHLEAIFQDSIETLRDKLKSSVEAKASDAFKALTTQTAYKGLKINENYGLQIIDKQNRIVTVRSAGAEQIVALSLIDGLNRTGRGIGPIVMDTPFGRLDLGHRERILKYLPTAANQLAVLVHSGEVRVDTDLRPIADRIGARYEIQEENQHHSILRKVES